MTMTNHEGQVAHRSWPEHGVWTVGVDGSECSRTALDWAVANCSGRATALRLVTAWQTPIYGPLSMTGPVAIPYDIDALGDAAREDVEELARQTAGSVGLPVEPIVVHAGAATALLDASEDGSLLVVGNRGRGGFARLLVGSTSNQCATHARVPTAVIPGDVPVDRAASILVGLDGSPNALAALQWALEFATPGMSIDVTWVWDASPLAVGADEFFFPDASETAEQRFDHVIDRAIGGVDLRGITIERNFVRGRPRSSLAAASEHADVVVVGARGHGAIGAALLGSVSSWVLHHVPRPIVIVPDGVDPSA